MDTNKKPRLLQLNGFKNAIFNTGAEPRELNLLELANLNQMIRSHIKTCSEMISSLNYFKDFESKIEKVLEDSFREEDNEYEIGNEFCMYLENQGGCSSNNEAAVIIQTDYEKKFGKSSLLFDPEHSYCYVYSKDKEEARKFLLFTYNKYIKPTLEPWYEGFDEFMQLLEKAPQKDKVHFIYLGH